MEEQRSIFHANGVPLKYSIHRVTRACPPSSCRVHSSAFFFFLLFFPLRGKKIVSYLRQGKASPLIPWPPLSNLLEILDHGRRGLRLRTGLRLLSSSFCRGGWLLAMEEVRIWLVKFRCPCTLPEQGEYFQVDSNSRGIQTRWRIIFEQTFK